jgi:hypothetical protein
MEEELSNGLHEKQYMEEDMAEDKMCLLLGMVRRLLAIEILIIILIRYNKGIFLSFLSIFYSYIPYFVVLQVALGVI